MHLLRFESQPLLARCPLPFPQPEATRKRERLRAKILAMLKTRAIARVRSEQVPSRVVQLVVHNLQNEWEASLSHRCAIIESSPKEEVSHGNTGKSVALHSERGLGDLCGFDGRVSARSNSSLLLLGRSGPVTGSAVRVVREPEAQPLMLVESSWSSQ